MELVLCLLCSNQADRARDVAVDSLRRTAPWPRPLSHARHGHASVLAFDGRFDRAIAEYSEVLAAGAVGGGVLPMTYSAIVECMFLANSPALEIQAVAEMIEAA